MLVEELIPTILAMVSRNSRNSRLFFNGNAGDLPIGYGSADGPTSIGSGGGINSKTTAFGSGGGGVYITTGSLTLDGTISADAQSTVYAFTGTPVSSFASGAGGSVSTIFSF